MSCDGNCMRSYHIGMKDIDPEDRDFEERDSEERELDKPPCNPMQMPDDLAARLDVSPSPSFQMPRNEMLGF